MDKIKQSIGFPQKVGRF